MVALNRVKAIVANMKEYMKLYRPEHSWLHAFTAFRLPSPLSASGEAESAAGASVTACLRRITKEAQLPSTRALSVFMMMLIGAYTHFLYARFTRALLSLFLTLL